MSKLYIMGVRMLEVEQRIQNIPINNVYVNQPNRFYIMEN